MKRDVNKCKETYVSIMIRDLYLYTW